MSLFITFEGPEGSGKSTQINLLCTYLLAQNYPVVQTREPGGTPIGDQIRKVLLSPEHAEMLPITEYLLFSASRAQLVSQFIRPQLAAGRIVLCDRYADSSLAYQGYAQGLDLDMLRQISRLTTGGLAPNCTIYFDLDVRAGLQRKQHASEPLDRLDAKSIEFHERVRRGYLAMAAQEPARWFVVNAEENVSSVQVKVREHVENLIVGKTTRA
jgi:dTMP kinase